jgi:hypothetical protein
VIKKNKTKQNKTKQNKTKQNKRKENKRKETTYHMLLQTLVRTWDLAKLYGFVLHASDAMDGNLQFTIMVMDSLKQKEMSGI